MGQHEDFGAEADPFGDGGDVRECHQGLEDRHLRRVHRGFAPRGGKTHHHVVEDIELVEADVFDALRQPANAVAAFAVANAWELNR